ncbi:MAG: hypothetical protein RDV48_29365 [Candidatus Eremiobacteraeota bacterium]|nr:hypothetical protein [Candidatus Eremiobacteraeota bacterium]
MNSPGQNRALLFAAEEASKHPEWSEYVLYCRAREKGLRKEAFAHLDTFIASTGQWPEELKRDFATCLLTWCETLMDADYGPFPGALKEKVIKPVMEKWCDEETASSAPFRWYGIHFNSPAHLEKALTLNPLDDRARIAVITSLAEKLGHSVHHLPDSYIGDPEEDMKCCAIAEDHIRKLSEPILKRYWEKELKGISELIGNYLEWKASGHGNLAVWGREQGKRVDSGVKAYYYER